MCRAAPPTSTAASSATATRRRSSCSACRPTLIAEHGAVSEPVARAMADGDPARRGRERRHRHHRHRRPGRRHAGEAGRHGRDRGVVTGRAARVRTFQFVGGREQVKFQSAQAALNMLRLLLDESAEWVSVMIDAAARHRRGHRYFIGSIPFALLLARRWGTRRSSPVGSGNVGAANVLRASVSEAGRAGRAARHGEGGGQRAAGAAGDRAAPGRAGGGRIGGRRRPRLSGLARIPRRQGRGDGVRRLRRADAARGAAGAGDLPGWASG